MSEKPQQQVLHADIPHEAAIILGMGIAKMVPQGMTGNEISIVFQALDTVRNALPPPQGATPKSKGK